MVTEKKQVAIIDEVSVRDKIYEVRGVKVMLDFDLAEIYGYETKTFNQQVRRNKEKFDADFMFQLTKEEIELLSRSQNVTSIQTKGIKGGRAYLPYAFTESGIYMLMTVLKGELATRQSKALIRTFRAMKDYIAESQYLNVAKELARIQASIADNLEFKISTSAQLEKINTELIVLSDRINDTIKRSEISPLLLDFNKFAEAQEFVMHKGELSKAKETYIDIYRSAQKTIHIVDDYIGPKTLYLLQEVKPGVSVTVFSDNVGKKLHASDVTDFCKEFPHIALTFKITQKHAHDRLIILDFETQDERFFLCGASSKDAGSKMTLIVELESETVKEGIKKDIRKFLTFPDLSLK